MQITLPPELEAMVQRDLATGRYATVDAYIAEAVGLLHERDHWEGESLEEERRKLRISMAQAERGELLDETEVRRRMQAMKAEWAAR